MSEALIIGCGPTLRSDLAHLNAERIYYPASAIFLVNDAVGYYPGPAYHAVSYHWNRLGCLLTLRHFRKYPKIRNIHGLSPSSDDACDFITTRWPWRPDKPSNSGGFAAWIAGRLGYESVYLCGFGGQGHFYDLPSLTSQCR